MQLLIVNQYFPPDQAATAQLLGQLAGDLAAHFNVRVVCGTPTYAPNPESEPINANIRITRIPLIPFSRRNIFVRIFNYLFFMLGAAAVSFLGKKPDVVMCWTDPPVVGCIGRLLKRLRGVRFVFVSQDVYPDVVMASGKFNFIPVTALLRAVTRRILSSADLIIAVGEDMRTRLIEKGCKGSKVFVIPNWQDTERLSPTSGAAFRIRHQISETDFVVMHSGNVGYSQDFETLLSAAEIVRNEKGILFLIVGEGARLREVRNEVTLRNISNVRFLPYQPAQSLSESLCAGDLHYVSLKDGFEGVIVPSKVYGIMSVGKPILLNVPRACDLYSMVQSSECGVLVHPKAEEVAATILSLKTKRPLLKKMGEAGRAWMEKSGGRKSASEAYRAALEAVMR